METTWQKNKNYIVVGVAVVVVAAVVTIVLLERKKRMMSTSSASSNTTNSSTSMSSAPNNSSSTSTSSMSSSNSSNTTGSSSSTSSSNTSSSSAWMPHDLENGKSYLFFQNNQLYGWVNGGPAYPCLNSFLPVSTGTSQGANQLRAAVSSTGVTLRPSIGAGGYLFDDQSPATCKNCACFQAASVIPNPTLTIMKNSQGQYLVQTPDKLYLSSSTTNMKMAASFIPVPGPSCLWVIKPAP